MFVEVKVPLVEKYHITEVRLGDYNDIYDCVPGDS